MLRYLPGKNLLKICISSVVLVMLVSVSSFAKTPPPTPPLPSEDQMKFSVGDNDGLHISISPITNPKKSKQYFAADLLKENQLPVYIKAVNKNPSTSFVITRKLIRLGDGSKLVEEEVGGPAIKGMGLWKGGGYLAAPIFFMAGAKKISKSATTIHYYVNKALYAKTLSPGETTRGFVYLKIPEERNGSESWSVNIKVIDLTSQERVNINIPISLDMK